MLLMSSSTLYGQQMDSLELTQASGDAYSYYQAIKGGNQLQDEGDLESAAKEYVKAVQMNPEGFEGWYNLGSTLLKGGMAKEGEQALKESLNRAENDEQLSNSLHNLGDAAYDAQRYEEALNYYKESLLRNPTSPDAQYNFNRAFEKLQQQQNKEQNEEQNEDQQQKDPPKQDKDDPQNEDPKDDNAKDKQEQQDQSGNEGDQNKDEQEQDKGEPQDNKDGKNNKPEEGGETKAKMTPEQIKGLLEAIQRAEEKTAEKANAKKAKGKKKSGEKDW